jgi:hypothetical protein
MENPSSPVAAATFEGILGHNEEGDLRVENLLATRSQLFP